MPLTLIDFALVVDKLTVSTTLSVDPIADVEVAVRVDETSKSIIDVVYELALVDDVIDFFAHTSNFAIGAKLSFNVLVILAGSELQALIDWDL